MKHKSVIDMVKTLGSRSFYCNFLLSSIQDVFRNSTDGQLRHHACVRYQEYCRIYLDEYTNQKQLRINWFGKNHDKAKHIYTRFLRRN